MPHRIVFADDRAHPGSADRAGCRSSHHSVVSAVSVRVDAFPVRENAVMERCRVRGRALNPSMRNSRRAVAESSRDVRASGRREDDGCHRPRIETAGPAALTRRVDAPTCRGSLRREIFRAASRVRLSCGASHTTRFASDSMSCSIGTTRLGSSASRYPGVQPMEDSKSSVIFLDVPLPLAIAQKSARDYACSHRLDATGVRHLHALFEAPDTAERASGYAAPAAADHLWRRRAATGTTKRRVG